MQSVLDIGRRVSLKPGAGKTAPALNPGFSYLRVQVDGRVAYFALGYQDPHPNGEIEVWYSREKEVLRLQNGRLVGAVGMAKEWRSVSSSAMPWSDDMKPASFSRVRDVSPGYLYGIHEQVRVWRVPPPANTKLVGVAPESLVWFEEVAEGAHQLPPSLYGLRNEADKLQVIYSEVCLDSELCFTWQRWQP